jgi:hypothetical protein
MAYDLASPEWRLLQGTANDVVERAYSIGLGALTAEEQAFFLVWIADGEVGNGGMHAICYNSSGDYLQKMPGAFVAVGAPEKAKLFERLLAAFGTSGPSQKHEIRLEEHAALSKQAVADIDALDDMYYSSTEDIHTSLLKLAREIRESKHDA